MAAAACVLVLCLLATFGRAFENNNVEFTSSSALGCGVHNVISTSSVYEASNVTELRCNVRTLHDQLPIINPIMLNPVSSVRVTCSDIVLFESSIDSGLLPSILRTLLRRNANPRRLVLDQCQLRRLPTGILSSLPGSSRIQSLSIRSSSAPAGWSLAIEQGAFSGLPSLLELDLSASNVWSIPRDTLCPLTGLKHLNLSSNKLQDVSMIAKGPERVPCQNCHDSTDSSLEDFNNSPRCLRSVETLDLSHNELTHLPDHFLASLRFLRELRLAWNGIATVGERSLAGLISLQKLDLSGNKLSVLPPDWLNDSPLLSELRLTDNSLAVLGPGLFSGLSQLSLLDLARNNLAPGSVGIQKDTFKRLVRLRELDLTSNKLNRLDANIFKDLFELQVLRLAGNQLTSIPDDMFMSLGNLHALELTANQLEDLPQKVLSPLRALRRLGASHNLLLTLSNNALANCSDLRELELGSNRFASLKSEVLAAVPRIELLDLSDNQLTVLPTFPSLLSLTVLKVSENQIATLPRDSLAKLSGLRMLDLSSNGLSNVEKGALSKNTRLEGLRIDANALTDLEAILTGAPASLYAVNASDNQLQHFDFGRLPGKVNWLDLHRNRLDRVRNHGGQGGRSLTFLDLSENLLERLEASDVPDQVMMLYLSDNRISHVASGTFIAKRNLTVADLSSNHLTELDINALQLGMEVPKGSPLPEILLSHNPLTCDCKMEWLQRANSLADSLRRYPRIADLSTVTCFLPHARATVTPVPIAHLSPSQFLCRYETHCFALCHCCDYDACDCEMTCPTNCTCYHDQLWGANVVDCSANNHQNLPERIPMDATQLYLDGNNLNELSSHVFIGKRKLETLYLNASKVSFIHNRTFNGLLALNSLYLQDNLLTELQGHEFFGLHNLKELHLENNAIISVHVETFSGLNGLRKLFIDGNRLVDFAPWSVLPQHEGNVRISMGGNWWTCRDCEVLDRLNSWTDSANQMLCLDTQHRPNGRLNLSVAEALKKCLHHQNSAISASIQHDTFSPSFSTSMLALVGFSLVVLLVMGILGFVFRRKITAWGKSLMDRGVVPEEEGGKLYDAYIVYSPRDEMLVNKEVGSRLDTIGASMCMHHRDLPARHLSASVDSAIDASRRTILVLSANFMQTEWPEQHLRIPILDAFLANDNKSVLCKLIVVITPSLNSLSPENNVPLQLWEPLHRLLNSANVLILGEKRRFGEDLVRAMPSSVSYLKKRSNAERSIKVWGDSTTKLYSPSPVYSSTISPYWTSPPAQHIVMPPQSGYMSSSSADGDESCHHTTSTDDNADSGDSLCYSTYYHQHKELNGPLNHVYSTIDERNVTTSTSIRPASQQRMYFV
ncbi:toll-like receptor Tollo [Neocloeon triangulifer]|uniref:toll-like receptor Tollo n=1 Tax=Neocloeon triangulifer TaxID=2078957 RepID=UPI00286F7667|nr:toll-like receptor Tollo [Neocloeon triangulifer]